MESVKEALLNRHFKKVYSHFFDDSLRRNSVFLLISAGFSALLGFVFWSIAAHRYSPSDIGVVTAVIGVASFIVGLSQLGYVSSLIRFMSDFKNKHHLINTVLAIVSLIAIVSSLVFIGISRFVFPKADFISESLFPAIFFLIYVLASAYAGILDGIFIAFRTTQYTLARNIATNATKILAIIIIGGGLVGLFYSISIAALFGSVVGFFLLWKKYKYIPSRKLTKDVKSMTKFSLVNYLSSGVASAVTALIPILITWKIGSSNAAFYYIAISITTLLNLIPSSIARSLFSESSNKISSLKIQLVKSIKLISLIIIPASIIFIVFGKYILLLFGKEYSESALICLRLLTLTSLISVVNYLGDSVLNIQKRLKMYSFVNIFCAVSTIIFIFPLFKYGLTGVGLGWLFSEIATALIYLFIFRKNIFTNQQILRANTK